jgi:large subunit ribosomal protein L25
MSATLTNLETDAREGTGSRDSRKARAAGRVPVNLYGHGQPNASLTVDAHALGQALATTAQVFTLKVGGQDESCLVREVQYDTYGQRVLHVDFTRIDLSEEVEVEVHLEFRGHPKGLADGGQQVIHHPSLAVRCRADAIPDVIVVDISEIEISHSLHAGEVEMPAGVVLDDGKMPADEPIVGVVVAKVEEPEVDEDALPEGEEGAEGAAPAEGAEGDGDAKSDDGDKGEG